MKLQTLLSVLFVVSVLLITTAISSGDDGFCEGKPDGLYANPDDITSFYQCSGGYTYLMYCPEGLVWNDDLKICDWPEEPECPGNQIFSYCPGCTTTCDMRNEVTICHTACIPGCTCPENTYLDGDMCVSESECPPVVECPGNQVYSTCAGCSIGCDERYQLIPCTRQCRQQCTCPFYPAYLDGDMCLSASECPPYECEEDHPELPVGNGKFCSCQQLSSGACPFIYAPVCDEDGNIYSNFCVFCHAYGDAFVEGTPMAGYKGEVADGSCDF